MFYKLNIQKSHYPVKGAQIHIYLSENWIKPGSKFLSDLVFMLKFFLVLSND